MGTYVLIMLITLAVIIFYVQNLVSDYFFKNAEVELLTKANILASLAAESDAEYGRRPSKSELEIAGSESRIIYLDKDAKVYFDNSEDISEVESLRGKTLLIPQVINALKKTESFEKAVNGSDCYVRAAVPIKKNNEVSGVVFLQSSANGIVSFLSDLRKSLLWIAFIVCILVGLLILALSNIFTAPIINITSKIKEMRRAENRRQLDINGSNEINALVSEFNSMVEEINTVSERRQEFVSNASHELKTPLSSVKLICDSILQNPNVDMEVVNEFLYDMNDEIDRLTRITNKLLSLTKMDASAEESEMIELSKINLKALIRRIVKALKPLADSKQIQMETLLTEDVFATVDSDKLWEAIYNIAENSIKYTEPGGWVYIEMYRDKQEVFITIADNGIGIKEGETEKIFDRFYRVDKARARETGGTGLGLSIARASVELHGGSIFVESEEGVGSLFRIIIPTMTVAGEKADEPEEETE
ncbi:MAG: hypothetical protein J5590_06860 [Clostridia bacterium]|nr:hypothetical protein [Clostridia bacterium]